MHRFDFRIVHFLDSLLHFFLRWAFGGLCMTSLHVRCWRPVRTVSDWGVYSSDPTNTLVRPEASRPDAVLPLVLVGLLKLFSCCTSLSKPERTTSADRAFQHKVAELFSTKLAEVFSRYVGSSLTKPSSGAGSCCLRHRWEGTYGEHRWEGTYGEHRWEGTYGEHRWEGTYGEHRWEGTYGEHLGCGLRLSMRFSMRAIMEKSSKLLGFAPLVRGKLTWYFAPPLALLATTPD